MTDTPRPTKAQIQNALTTLAEASGMLLGFAKHYDGEDIGQATQEMSESLDKAITVLAEATGAQ